VRRLPHPGAWTWPLRVRLTAAFASVIALVLAAAGLLIFVQFSHYIDSRTDEELRERAITFTSLARDEVHPARIVALSGEAFAQIFDVRGRVVAATRSVGTQRLLTGAQLAAAQRAPVLAVRPHTPPTDDGVRLRAFVIDDDAVAVIAESRDDRERELKRLGLLLALSLPGALLLASLTGYQVAGAALRPVDRMRRRAAQIGDADLSQRLDQPGTNDELDRLASTLNDLLARLERALERERQIVGDASHELRTPIAVLRTRLDVALRGDPAAPALRAALTAAHADAVRLTRLADDLLVLARADQGQLPLRLQPVEVQDLLEATVRRHEATAAAQERTISATVDVPGGAVLLADPDRLAQVLDNLVVNALRYGAGPIELIARPARSADAVELAVRDHGDGFPPGLLERAFERFSHGEAAQAHGGSGLGLAIVAALVRAHGGTVTARNAAGGGAEVAAALPLA
jgi:two-component system OmpR family sensor kinase